MTYNIEYSYAAAKLFGCVLIVMMVSVSCKKTEYEQLRRPYNTIEHFGISGYGDLDSIRAVIDNDSIKLYWSADSVLPEKIKPYILVAEGATISPASGAEVPFSESTVYTVTAEDGTKRQYVLRPIAKKAIPVLSGFVNEINWNYSGPDWQWGNRKKLKINGQYFLHYNDASGIRVYAQRLRDGYEFDLPVDPDQTSSTQVALDLPKLTTDLDSGMHRIYVQVGDFPSNSLEVWMATPKINDIIKSVTLREAGQTIYIGDTLHYTLEVDDTRMEPELFNKYFNSENYLYYQARGSFLENYLYAKYTTDLYVGGERQAIIKNREILVPVTEAVFGGFIGRHTQTVGSVLLNSELFLYSIGFEFMGKAYPDGSTGQPIRNRSTLTALTSDNMETSYKTRFARR